MKNLLKSFVFSASLAAAVGLSADVAQASDSLTMDDFVYTNKLVVAGYTGSETLANFPVLVRISTSLGDFQYSRLRSAKGGDLAFFAEDGTRLASEVDTWTTSGTSLVWVKLPSMAQGTPFYMCYRLTDELAAVDTMVENPNPWGDYVGVWHMRETGTSNPIADSSTNGLNGTTTVGEGVNESNGAIGRARRIAKNNDHAPGIIVDVNSDATKKAVADSLGTHFQASYWIRSQGQVTYSYMLGRRKGDYGASWGVQFENGNPPSKVRIFSGGVFNASSDNECTLTDAGVGTTLSDGTWRKVDVIWKERTEEVEGETQVVASYDFYIDGAFVESKDLQYLVNLNESANIGIGCSTQDSYGSSPPQKKGRRLNGDMDEVRLRPGIVSADWIKADYDTVNNAAFVTPAPPEVTWVDDSGAAPGVSDVHFDNVTFAGTVENCGGFASCSIQCKVWAADGTEPESWTTLTTGLVAADDFSAVYPGLTSGVTYSYKLRAAGAGDVASEPVEGSFTTLMGFAVTWSEASAAGAAAKGIVEIHHDKVVVAGTVSTLGAATSCVIEWKCWADGESEPESWTTITSVNGAVAFEADVDGLDSATTYNYALRAVPDDGETTTPVTGTFTTEPGLTILWSESTGIAEIGYDYVRIGGTVRALGDASSCEIQRKIWVDGESEPADWTTFETGLVKNDSFTDTVTGLTAGTTYSYKFRAHGNDEEAAEVAGTFTTLGDEGETIGSDFTHFFDDGTNAVWVANNFERYLPFTVTGYTGTETLTNFPVLVEVRNNDTNGFTYGDFYHYDGSDIVFVDEKGHIIPHELDTWNKNGMSLIWVRLPEMRNGTKFTMCYRSPLVYTDANPRPPDPGNTFEPYVGVWHMNEREDGVVNLKDSSVNNLETETHAMSLAENNGRVGYARRVAQSPGSSSSYGRIIAFDHDDILRTGVGNVFTFSGWYKLVATPPKWAYLVSRKSEDADKGWGIQYDEKDSTTELRVWSGSSEKNKFQIFKTSGMLSTGWNYWTFIYDGSVIDNGDGTFTTNQLFHAYLNGEELSTTAGGFPLTYPVVNDENATYDHLVIGGQQNGTGAFNGLVDEARYSKGMRSADWIKAEYDSSMQQVNWQDANKRFVTKGTVSHDSDSLVPVVVWERGDGLPDTIIDVSYAYVQFAGTVTYCGAGADKCRIEYQLWADGEHQPETWTVLTNGVIAGTYFSIPVTGLKQDSLYNFSIRAVNVVDGQERQNHEHAGKFRTNGNVNEEAEGELLRVGNRFCHRYGVPGSYTFTTPDYVTNVEILVVGGGGAGGYMVGGGGGGGGLFYSEAFEVTTSTTYRVVVGHGGKAATDLTERSGNGGNSWVALASDTDHPLILMHGGGAGGSYVNDEAIAKGADGASGGGGTYAFFGGEAESQEIDGVSQTFGHKGGRGNDFLQSGSIGKVAAGGGGGAGRAGLGATFDAWSAGGAGGVGVGNAMTGEQLFYGAGGGGGYIYRSAVSQDGTDNFTKPGGGGSGIGGNAADVRNETLATSGIANTGAGGGGGSSRAKSDGKTVDASFSTYWQGGDGGDGVVLISYEIHGREPISEDPRITMTSCDYTDEKGYADIAYRAYWAGVQAYSNNIYVLYSTVSEEDVAAGNGELIQLVEGSIGVGKTTFTPPAVGYTYWVRLVAKKDANSFMYSDEIASFEVPAIRLTGANWYMPANTDDNKDPSQDYADVYYSLYDTAPDARLYCYWSENQADLEGDAAPTGANVHFLDLGTGKAAMDGTFTIPATEGMERDKVYYIRLATGNEAGTKYFLSKLILEFETVDKPRVIFPEATWENHRTTIEFLLTTSTLDPDTVELYALYGPETAIKGKNPFGQEGVHAVNLGKCSDYPTDVETVTQFPLWSPVDTNYYVRLVLVTNGVPVCYSQRTQYLDVITHVPPNTLLVYANADSQIGCYGDEPQALTYTLSYGGRTEGPGWDYWESEGGSLTGELSCGVTSTSPSGQYEIGQGTLALSNGGQTYFHDDPVFDPDTGDPVIDPATGQQAVESVPYYYVLIFTGSRYVVTNAQFTVTIADARTIYTGNDFNVTDLDTTVEGLRNNQPITYMYRVGTQDWADTITTTYSDIWTHIVQFKATAPNHDEERGTFMITVDPAPLSATISAEDLNYLGIPQLPTITKNVTGHVRPDLNPLTEEYRDEADEWSTSLPTFTLPGTYKLFYRVSAPNHVSFTTNCTFTVEKWDYKVNMDGQEGFAVPIEIRDPSWLLNATGKSAAEFADNTDNKRYKLLDAACANGLKLWQNYMLDRTDLSKKLVAAIRQSGDRVNENTFVVYFPNVSVDRSTGLDVGFRLDRKLKGESEFTKGELSDKYEMNVSLGPDDPTGLYVFNIVLTPPKDETTGEPMYGGGESVLASIATVGVLRVSSAMTNTVTVAPWKSQSLGTEAALDVTVSDVINPNSGISGGDLILAYDAAAENFDAWSRSQTKDEWNALLTLQGVSVGEAATNRFAPGKAFWLVRSAPGEHIYLIGRYVGDQYSVAITGGTTEDPGFTMVANPTMADVALNDLVFDGGSPAAGDRIVVQDAAGFQRAYVRNAANSEWGRHVSAKSGDSVTQTWDNDDTVPSGTGFWYVRTDSSPLTIKFGGEP